MLYLILNIHLLQYAADFVAKFCKVYELLHIEPRAISYIWIKSSFANSITEHIAADTNDMVYLLSAYLFQWNNGFPKHF